jgi:ferric-dicitrate binding protein FerR (iron transport regulator)
MVRLTDGTRVTLGADSRLRYARSFGERDRTVWVDGDAYFDVAPSPSHPFRVQAGPSLIRVLGTAFTVRARPDESSAEVVVESGAVSLSRAEGDGGRAPYAVTLVRGDLGRIDVSGVPIVQHNVDVASYTAWTAGKLTFRATPLAAVTHELERWYDIQITVADPSAASVPVTMTFDDVSVDAALQRLSDALNMRYARTGKSVRLTP